VFAALLAPAVATAADWGTYGFSNNRSGLNPSEKTLTPANVKSLKQRWSASVGGFINAQPVVASGVRVGRRKVRTDLVYVGSESGHFAAVNAANGRVVWRRKLGSVHTSCTDLPKYGITGTAAISRFRHSVFVVTKGKAFQLDLATGRTKHKWTITKDPKHEHNWSALTLSRGILYVALAGVCDTLPYRGQIVATKVSSRKRVGHWYVTGRRGPAGGGIWSFGGVSADSRGDIYTATGDAAGSAQHARYAEHVVRLSPHLKVRSSNYPGVSGRDADFGATPLLYRAPGCPSQLAVGNKYGSFFVYNRSRIGRGPVQRIRLGGSILGQHGLIGTAAYWPQRRTLYVSNSRPHGKYRPGIVAFRVTSRCRLAKAWNARGPRNLKSSPTVANGVVYYGTGANNTVVALDARTGKHLKTIKVKGAVFNAPSVINGFVYAGSWSGRLYAFGVPRRP
jgi:putative pyrroloquinoline-quinone binding quinoprotein/putative pyrroloquinoline-quinone-binding quinoprotein